jgi:hypothetical protein
MKPAILFKREWTDDDMIMLRAEICDGRSLFSTDIYVGFSQLKKAAQELGKFKDQIYGGIFNLRFGEFGSEYASGALYIRFHFVAQAKLFVRIHAESEFDVFQDRKVASSTTMYLVSEPALLDNFIASFDPFSQLNCDVAELEGIIWR